ncbi:hypothetical protein TNCV_877891 [Trichonephila clavipes]|nr:hypothetical protein TNCV_877891 [Trichonephila clavipes]
MGRSDVARRCWQEWVDSGSFQRHDGSGRPRTTADREDRSIVKQRLIHRYQLSDPEPFGHLYRHTYSQTVRRRHSENCFATVPFAVPWPYFSEDKARPHADRVAMNCLTACQTLPWPAGSLFNRGCLGYDGKVTASTRECS